MSAIDDGPDSRDSASGSDSEAVSAGTGGGILGNLPNSRPSVRSPRRAESDSQPEIPGDGDASHNGPEGAHEEPPRSVRRSSPVGPGPAGEPDSGGPEIEALARGAIMAVEAVASTGLRIAGRAAARLRDVIEPR